jgi:hypothetical protein
MSKPPIPETATFERRLVNCGKARCGQCQRAASHGPYWFATWKVEGKMKHRYVGKTRPVVAIAAQGGGVQSGPGLAKAPPAARDAGLTLALPPL